MTAVTLNANDAAELAEMLQFLADWLNRDPGRLGASLEDFVSHPDCLLEPSSASAAGLPGVDLEGVLQGGGCNDRAATTLS